MSNRFPTVPAASAAALLTVTGLAACTDGQPAAEAVVVTTVEDSPIETTGTTLATTVETEPAPEVDRVHNATAAATYDFGDVLFRTPDGSGLCWLYVPEKSGTGLCTVPLTEPPLLHLTEPPLRANAFAFEDGTGPADTTGIVWAHNHATGHEPFNVYQLAPGEYVDYRGVRCEALDETAMSCSYAGDTVVYAEGRVTPDLHLP